MRAIELAGVFAVAAEGADVLALAVVLIDVAGAVAIADVDIAVGRDRQIGRAVLRLLAVGAGLVGFDSSGYPSVKTSSPSSVVFTTTPRVVSHR